MCDWIDNAITLQMGHADGQVYGYIHLPCRVEMNGRLGSQRQRSSGGGQACLTILPRSSRENA
jgi:hypothetical protein